MTETTDGARDQGAGGCVKPAWPPTTVSPYERPEMQAMKPGNFFTLCAEDHPAYDLFRELDAQGWEYDISSSRHWCYMTKGKAFVQFSLFGQGMFGDGDWANHSAIGFEDTDDVWTDALPHIATFMRTQTRSEFRQSARAAVEKAHPGGSR